MSWSSAERELPEVLAAQAMSDLNIFYAIIAICEGGTLRAPSSNAAAQRIIKICKSEASKRLWDYDRNIAEITRQRDASGE